MKYIDLKKKLKDKIENSYLISGDDRYLCFDALKKIEESVNIQFKEMNSISLNGENVSAKDIVESANIYPFADNYRLVIVKNFSPSKNKEEFKIIEKYLSNPLSTTVLVFFNIDNADFFKGMKNLTSIDCSKIDTNVISSYVKNILAKNQIGATIDAINDLILFCNNDMSRVTNELEKLIAYVYDTKTLTSDIVKKFVAQDREYQVFQLSEYLAKNDAENALRLVDSFMIKSGAVFQVLTPLYNNYRRALFVSLNKDKTISEMASLLGIKEYAVKILKNQVDLFNPKQLKSIVDMIAKFDKKIKNGEMKESIAIKTVVFNILNLRGQNGK